MNERNEHNDTDQLMRDAYALTVSMALREGPRDGHDQLEIAKVNALLAIAQELKRANDRKMDDMDNLLIVLQGGKVI